MTSLTLKQTITPSDRYNPQTRTLYEVHADDVPEKMGPYIQNISVITNPLSVDVDLGLDGSDKALTRIQHLLAQGGISSETGEIYNSSSRRITVRNANPNSGLIQIVSALGKHDEGIPPRFARQIIEFELKRTGKKPSETGMATISETVITGETFSEGKAVAKPRTYQSIDITNPLSQVTHLREEGEHTATGVEIFTHIEARTAQALQSIAHQLKEAGINNHSTKNFGIKADATVRDVAGALSDELIAPSIAQEIASRTQGFADRALRSRSAQFQSPSV